MGSVPLPLLLLLLLLPPSSSAPASVAARKTARTGREALTKASAYPLECDADGAGVVGVYYHAHLLEGVARVLLVGRRLQREEARARGGHLERQGPRRDERIGGANVAREGAAQHALAVRARLLRSFGVDLGWCVMLVASCSLAVVFVC